MLARSLDRAEIGGVTRGGPPRRPGWSGAGVGDRGNGVGDRGKVPMGAPVGGGGTGGSGGAASCGGQGADDSAIGSGGGVT